MVVTRCNWNQVWPRLTLSKTGQQHVSTRCQWTHLGPFPVRRGSFILFTSQIFELYWFDLQFTFIAQRQQEFVSPDSCVHGESWVCELCKLGVLLQPQRRVRDVQLACMLVHVWGKPSALAPRWLKTNKGHNANNVNGLLLDRADCYLLCVCVCTRARG